MRVTLSVKLSMKNEKHRQIAEALQREPSVSGAIAAILEYYYFERDTDKPVTVTQDNTAVLAAIAELSRKIDRIVQMPRQATPDIARKEEELTEDDVELSKVFVTALKKAARPGMRYEETQ